MRPEDFWFVARAGLARLLNPPPRSRASAVEVGNEGGVFSTPPLRIDFAPRHGLPDTGAYGLDLKFTFTTELVVAMAVFEVGENVWPVFDGVTVWEPATTRAA